MEVPELAPEDIEQLERHGISRERAMEQLRILRRGPQPPNLARPCSLGDGIVALKPEEVERYVRKYREAAGSAKVCKFVPASGAATRMMKPISWVEKVSGSPKRKELEEQARLQGEDYDEFVAFADGLPRLACFGDLRRAMARDGLDADELYRAGELKPLVRYLLGEPGLGYAELPKALIKFHRYGLESRTALEEHLSDAAAYATDGRGRCRLHFTVSPRHKEMVDALLSRVTETYEKKYGVKYEIQTTIQDPATDTLALDERGKLCRQANGRLLLRPGGHGALIGNLERTQAEVVFINNVDDVIHESLRSVHHRYQMALGGFLFELRQRIFFLLERLAGGGVTEKVIQEGARVAETVLSRALPAGFPRWDPCRQVATLHEVLDRPLRICGVVANRGEPGGGPFWVSASGGNETLQIVEKAQVDGSRREQVAIFASATHFNPVHIVATLVGYRGRFSLQSYVDPTQAFVTEKLDGERKIRALEWPGLWNGGMAFWNTVFVEIPREAFSPVKTISDLLKPAHQGSLAAGVFVST